MLLDMQEAVTYNPSCSFACVIEAMVVQKTMQQASGLVDHRWVWDKTCEFLIWSSKSTEDQGFVLDASDTATAFQSSIMRPDHIAKCDNVMFGHLTVCQLDQSLAVTRRHNSYALCETSGFAVFASFCISANGDVGGSSMTCRRFEATQNPDAAFVCLFRFLVTGHWLAPFRYKYAYCEPF